MEALVLWLQPKKRATILRNREEKRKGKDSRECWARCASEMQTMPGKHGFTARKNGALRSDKKKTGTGNRGREKKGGEGPSILMDQGLFTRKAMTGIIKGG